MTVGIVLHFVKRILRFDIPLSVAGALATWRQRPLSTVDSPAAVITELGLRFVIVACTVGYGLSLLLYAWLGRRELPMYTVRGWHFGRIAGISLVLVSTGLSIMLAAVLLLAGWMGQ